jgi:Tol biopolymer transport system component/DNA-binding winged helix-turn-helix (wHTH) protein
MASLPNPSPRAVFGPFEFEQDSGDLRKFGNRIRLQGKPLQILSMLLDQPGQVVSRDELQKHLWQETTFVDFEQGLNTAVNKLRQALGDSAGQPRYIETVPGKGYRFIAPLQGSPARPAAVLEMVPAPPPASTLRVEPVLTRPPRQKTWVAAGAAALVTVMLAGGFWLVSNGSSDSAAIVRSSRFAVVPPSGFELQAGVSRQAFALSPGGTHLAFTAMDASGVFSAFIRDFSDLEPRRLAGSEGVHTLFWSPDNRSIFMTVKGKIQRATLEGDAHVILGDSPDFLLSGAWVDSSRLLLGGAWKSYWMSPSGGSSQPMRELYRWPQVLPGGKYVLYTYADPTMSRHRARVARFGDPDSVKDRLLESDSRVHYTASRTNPASGYLMYVRAGALLAQPFDPRSLRLTGEAMPIVNQIYSFRPTGAADFSVSSSGGAIAYQNFASRSQMVWVDRQGRRIASAGPANINVKSGRLSPDGRKLVIGNYDLERGGQNLWIVDTKTNAARELTLDPGVRDAPIWSPDSRRLVFMHSSIGRPPQLRIRGREANDPQEETLGPDGFQMPSGWSPDGRFIVFANTGTARFPSETQSDVLLFDLANGRKAIPLLSTRFHEANATFSPDGRWLTFTSNESGRAEVYIQAFESATGTPRVTGERHLVTRSGAQTLRWRADGKELFYLAFDGRVYSVPARFSGGKPEFGPPAPLFDIPVEARAAIHSVLGFDVTPDGERFLVPSVSSALAGPSLVLLQNWESDLPQNRRKVQDPLN